MNAQRIEMLANEARNSREPGRLLVIARALEELSAWDEAEKARRKANEIVSEQLTKQKAAQEEEWPQKDKLKRLEIECVLRLRVMLNCAEERLSCLAACRS